MKVLDDRHDRPGGRRFRESPADLGGAVDLRKGRRTRNHALTRCRQRRNNRFERIERRPCALVIETASAGHDDIRAKASGKGGQEPRLPDARLTGDDDRDRPMTPGARKGHLEELQLVAPRDQGRTPIHDRHARSMPAITRLITTNLGEKAFKFRISTVRGSRGSKHEPGRRVMIVGCRANQPSPRSSAHLAAARSATLATLAADGRPAPWSRSASSSVPTTAGGPAAPLQRAR